MPDSVAGDVVWALHGDQPIEHVVRKVELSAVVIVVVVRERLQLIIRVVVGVRDRTLRSADAPSLAVVVVGVGMRHRRARSASCPLGLLSEEVARIVVGEGHHRRGVRRRVQMPEGVVGVLRHVVARQGLLPKMPIRVIVVGDHTSVAVDVAR